MRKLSKVFGARLIAFSLVFSIAVMPFTVNAASGKLEVGSVTEFGSGGEPVTTTQGDCTGTSFPSCPSEDSCECLTVNPMIQAAGEGNAVPVNSAKARPLAETMLVDLTDSSSNGTGGLCHPWNGVGVFAISSSTSITLAQQGSLCDDENSTALIATGTFDLENGKGAFSGAEGRGKYQFRPRPRRSQWR